jgi:hypothetical protein
MEITGRITRDAVVTALKDERTVINFNLAVPGGYKDKNGVWVDRTEFVRCAYWLNSGAARLLTKGTVVQCMAGFRPMSSVTPMVRPRPGCSSIPPHLKS